MNIYESGAEAPACIEHTGLDLAILDVMFPDADGFQICKKIRETSYCPVIMLTAGADDGDKIMGLALGADDYITKPFSPLEAVARVKTQLRRYGVRNFCAITIPSWPILSGCGFRQLRIKLFLRIIAMLVISASIIYITYAVLLRGNFANMMMAFLRNMFGRAAGARFDYNFPITAGQFQKRSWSGFLSSFTGWTRDAAQTGPGLAIARQIVTLHKGTITAESRDGLTVFTVTIPALGLA